MTRQERRIAELAAQNLVDWSRELALGSETRRDLQQTARAYRFAARAGPVALRALPGSRAQQDEAPNVRPDASRPGLERAVGRPALAEAPRGARRPLAFEERVELTTALRPAAPEHAAAARRRPVALLNGLRGAPQSPTAP